MNRYVDAYVLPIKKNKVAAYRKMAQWGAKTWMKFGALEYAETVGEELKLPVLMHGSLPFPKGIRAKKGETVVVAWVVFKSKKHRNAVNARVMKMMQEPKNEEAMKKMVMPFNPKRMMYGGFKTLVMKQK